ncbi:MAG: tetratricopeptide repeat protein, partial [Candidatus Electrothrix sp. AUS1_2]|nr:tetratricopeptide repeat protein [Candidatus Electrothrix sp. AUS1_2]
GCVWCVWCVGADASWQQLAQVCNATGRVVEAEQWYRKALAVRRAADDQSGTARTLSNLADLLADDPFRLAEARSLAEESLTIFETLDSIGSRLWITYDLIAYIADQQGENSLAAKYRAKGRQSYFSFPAWRQESWSHEPLIAAVVEDGDVKAALDPYGEAWGNLKVAIQRILKGEQDEAALSEPLSYTEAAVIRAILEGIEERA